MKISFWAPYISDSNVKAICWTLIHSLWIGLAIALLAGLVINVTRRRGAAVRYRLLCSILVLFVLSVSVAYYIEALPAPAGQLSADTTGITVNNINYVATNSYADFHQGPFNKGVAFLNRNMDIIFLVWLLFFVMKSLKMLGGLLYIRRLRNHKVHEVAPVFKHTIEIFSKRMGIRRAVLLLQSELVKVPVAVGWLKPVILLPMGIVLHLPAEQLESILWHELAHIRRQDYLVNILQGMLETVFFFNPGLMRLSSLIRAEREACCDDMVISRTQQKASYLEALLAFGCGGFNQAGLAMSIGSGNQLRDRMKRIINQENKKLSMAEKTVLAAGLILLSAFAGLPVTSPPAGHSIKANKMITTPVMKPAANTRFTQEENEIKGTNAKGKSMITTGILTGKRRPGITRFKTTQQRKKLVPDPAKVLSLELRDTGLAVNGQPGALHQKPNKDVRAPKILHNDHPLEEMVLDVMNDLISENIAKDKTSLLSFTLSNKFLIVNGVKQPDEIQERLRNRYLKDPPVWVDRQSLNDPLFGLHYAVRKNHDHISMGMGISIDRSEP